MTVKIDKWGKVEFKGFDGEWKDIGYWDGLDFKPIIEEPPPVLATFTKVFVDGAGVVNALLPDVEIRGESMGAATHVAFYGQTFKIHAISTMEYVSTLDLPDPKLWAETDWLVMPVASQSIPHLRLDISGEDVIRFRQAVELHQAIEFKNAKAGMVYESGPSWALDPIDLRTNQSRALRLMDKIPALKERVNRPCTCPISQSRYTVEDCIMHLNDDHHPNSHNDLDGWEPWTRERIADWVDSLPFDFTVQPTPTRPSREKSEVLSEHMKVDLASTALVTEIQEAIDEGLIQKMVDSMIALISSITNEEEDK